MVKELDHARALVGRSVPIPGEHASEEDRRKFAEHMAKIPDMTVLKPEDPEAVRDTLRKLGAPEDAEGYKLPSLPEGQKPFEGLNLWAHKAGLTQGQFDTLVSEVSTHQAQVAERQAAQHNADMEALHRDWGYAFDGRREQALSVAKLTDNPRLAEAIEQNRVSAADLRWLYGLAERFGKEPDVGADNGAKRVEMTPAEAQMQYDEIMRNRQHPYFTLSPGPEKDRVIAQVRKLKQLSLGPAGNQEVATFNPDSFELDVR